jgi:hypothetical protein
MEKVEKVENVAGDREIENWGCLLLDLNEQG